MVTMEPRQLAVSANAWTFTTLTGNHDILRWTFDQVNNLWFQIWVSISNDCYRIVQ